MSAGNFFKVRNGLNLGSLAADPSSGGNGDTYYNSATNTIREYVNGAWRNAVQADLTQTLSNKQVQYSSSTDSTSTGSAATLQAFTTGVIRLTNASLASISGIPAGSSGQALIVENKTGNQIQILNEDAGATAANRIQTGTGSAVTMTNNASFTLTYDSTSARWNLVGLFAPSSGITAPAITTHLSGSGTYVTPIGALYLHVYAIGGGGGGGGNGTNTNPAEGTDGGTTTFIGTGVSISAGGGGRGRNYVAATNSTGGTATGGDVNLPGSPGPSRAGTSTGTNGQCGASSYFGSGGIGGEFNNSSAPTSGISPGSGGGAAAPSSTSVAGGAGGSGGYVEKVVSSPVTSYTYSVGAAGAAGAAGSSGRAGGAGAPGIIIIEAYFQ